MPSIRSTPALLILLAAPAILSAQTDPALSRFVQPGAKVLISIDWKHVRQSNAGAMLREGLNARTGAGTAIPGIEFLNDVDRVVVSSPGRKAGEEASGDTPILIVASGHFDLAKVRGSLTKFGAKAQMFNSIPVYRPQGEKGKEMAVVLLDPQTVLVGDAPTIFASLERSAFPPPAQDPNSVFARAAEMEANYDAWMIVTDPEELADNRLADVFSEGQLGAEARGFEAGVSVRSGLAVDLTVRFETEVAANKLTSAASEFLKLAALSKAGNPSLLEFAKKLKFTSEGSVAKIALRLTPQEFEKSTHLLASLPKQQATAGTVANIRPLSEPARTPIREEKRVIRIEGLDDGTHEIPYDHP